MSQHIEDAVAEDVDGHRVRTQVVADAAETDGHRLRAQVVEEAGEDDAEGHRRIPHA